FSSLWRSCCSSPDASRVCHGLSYVVQVAQRFRFVGGISGERGFPCCCKQCTGRGLPEHASSHNGLWNRRGIMAHGSKGTPQYVRLQSKLLCKIHGLNVCL